ncbi:MAG: hexulose-6-phosphate synthase [Candidimonas sp.]|nr:MAG: hexulose-6-phosphate synthase [Candidimonas sp.]TAM19458.1 MAG: hexulose-6-phosphate synthase [Candidimonas sp.]TAM75369.1 MAG: hexulose-6-phosphate synthase [Candidimonas sp.]
MRTRHQRTLKLIFARPASANIKWSDVVALLKEREGSRLAAVLFNQIQVMHRPHPNPNKNKGAVENLRKWLEENGITP